MVYEHARRKKERVCHNVDFKNSRAVEAKRYQDRLSVVKVVMVDEVVKCC